MAILRQLGTSRGDFVQGAARTYNGASEMVDEHPWGAKAHASAVAFLPAFVGNLLGDDRVASPHDLVRESAVQALAVGGQLALFGRFAAPDDLVAPALFPS